MLGNESKLTKEVLVGPSALLRRYGKRPRVRPGHARDGGKGEGGGAAVRAHGAHGLHAGGRGEEFAVYGGVFACGAHVQFCES